MIEPPFCVDISCITYKDYCRVYDYMNKHYSHHPCHSKFTNNEFVYDSSYYNYKYLGVSVNYITTHKDRKIKYGPDTKLVKLEDILNQEEEETMEEIKPPFCVYTKHLDGAEYEKVKRAFEKLGYETYKLTDIYCREFNFTGTILNHAIGHNNVNDYSPSPEYEGEVTVLSVRELFDLVDKRKKSVVDRVFKELDLHPGDRDVLSKLYDKGYLKDE